MSSHNRRLKFRHIRFSSLLSDKYEAPRLPLPQEIDSACIAHKWDGEMCKAVESRLNVQGIEEACRIGHENRALQELFPFGDVAETPDSPDDLARNSLRPGIALEDTAIREMQDIAALSFRMVVQILCAAQELIGVLK
jgi:hypothetical protein